jgi:hypothetical protein
VKKRVAIVESYREPTFGERVAEKSTVKRALEEIIGN